MTPSAALNPLRSDTDSSAQGLRLGIGLTLASLLGLVVIQYTLPPHTDAHYWGLNPEGLQQFAAVWGLSRLPVMGIDQFSLVFRLLLVSLWTGYALAVLSAWQGAMLQAKPLLTVITGAALSLAFFAPPLLSHDVYAYAAHGRLAAQYGLNPYFHRPDFLAAARDPVAAYVTWNWPSVYGPVWTRLEITLAALLPSLWAQVAAFKVVEAAALVSACLAGRRIAARLCPGRENLTMLAIGLNPLLLLEGPGSGHNDLLMVCLLLVGAIFFVEMRYGPAALFLGLSVGIKLVTLAVLPWVWLEWSRGRPWRQKVMGGAVAAALTLLPMMLFYVGLWHGWATLAPMMQRAALPSDAAATLMQRAGLPAAYFAMTVWLVLRPRPGQWLSAWAILAALLMFFALGLPFPWYICWFWPVCLLRWDKFSMGLSAACFGLSLAWTAGYGILTEVQ